MRNGRVVKSYRILSRALRLRGNVCIMMTRVSEGIGLWGRYVKILRKIWFSMMLWDRREFDIIKIVVSSFASACVKDLVGNTMNRNTITHKRNHQINTSNTSPPTPPATPAAIGVTFVLLPELVVTVCVDEGVTTNVEVYSTVIVDPSAFMEVDVLIDSDVKALEVEGLVEEGIDEDTEGVDGGCVTFPPHDVENNVAVGELVVTVTVIGTATVVVDVPPEIDKTSKIRRCYRDASGH